MKRPSLADSMSRFDTRTTGLAPIPVSTPARPARKAEPQQGREGKKQAVFWISEACKRQLKITCGEQGKTEQVLLTEALNDLFAKYGKPTIA